MLLTRCASNDYASDDDETFFAHSLLSVCLRLRVESRFPCSG